MDNVFENVDEHNSKFDIKMYISRIIVVENGLTKKT